MAQLVQWSRHRLSGSFACTLLIGMVAMLPLSHCCWRPLAEGQEKLRDAALRKAYSSDPFGCTPEKAASQANKLVSGIKQRTYHSACADHWWLRHLAELNLKVPRHTTVVDVGCNKGYFSATALNYLAPAHGDQLQKFYNSHLKQKVYSRPCGGCNECKQAPAKFPNHGQQTVDVFCYEPSNIHLKSLTTARDSVYGPPDTAISTEAAKDRTHVRFHIRQAAVSNRTGVAQFPVECNTNYCSLDSKSEGALQSVNVTTIDTEMASLGLPYIDVLKIDTEGFDPAVLAGAYAALRNHRIGILSFEYHHLWSRSGGTLKQCSRYLQELGYICFYDGPVLAKITGSCWDNRYELKRWSNIVCVLQGSEMEVVMTSGSFIGRELGLELANMHH
ncbi:hypothetical protein Agub_g12099 [Astrephomene gubernaculifera]|uniref:Methyltransferase FkbM domain-containing protein n=1 Tax=Astrephomene gubernaculifera TaxID=47775 RepID=A0AAD3E0L1_9CHLO|nr:hypothetical protein Agub_g12099 [Astrephomene gubernaculifera]